MAKILKAAVENVLLALAVLLGTVGIPMAIGVYLFGAVGVLGMFTVPILFVLCMLGDGFRETPVFLARRDRFRRAD
jgi:hypothetical protein